MAIGIIIHYDLGEPFPILHRLCSQKIMLISLRPPYIFVCRKSGEYIPQVMPILMQGHLREPPVVIGME